MDSAAEAAENQNEAATPRSCAICNATKTPLWRGGPAGPKSLCNACGIKYRKKSGDPPVWIAKEEMKSKANRRSKSAGGVSFKVRLSASNSDVLLQRLFLHNQKLPEEEEAAVLLMALSCGLCESKIQSFAQHL